MDKIMRAGLLAVVLGVALVAPITALAESKEPPAEKAEAGKDDKEEDKGGSGFSQGPIFVNIAPLVLPVIGDEGPEEIVSMIVTLEVANDVKAAEVRKKLPRLNDGFMTTLYGALDKKTIKRGKLVDVTRVRQKLRVVTDEVLGVGFVDNILIQAVAERKI